MTIRYMRVACWIPKGTDIHSQYVTLAAFPLQHWLYESSSMLRYTYIAIFFNPVIFTIVYWDSNKKNTHIPAVFQLVLLKKWPLKETHLCRSSSHGAIWNEWTSFNPFHGEIVGEHRNSFENFWAVWGFIEERIAFLVRVFRSVTASDILACCAVNCALNNFFLLSSLHFIALDMQTDTHIKLYM